MDFDLVCNCIIAACAWAWAGFLLFLAYQAIAASL